MEIPEINSEKLSRVMEIIDKISERESNENIDSLVKELKELSGKSEIDVSDFDEYWGYISLEDLARTILMPEPEKSGLSDSEIYDIVIKICNAELSESETDYLIKVLEKETGLDVTDYIYYMDAEPDEIAKKILSDRR